MHMLSDLINLTTAPIYKPSDNRTSALHNVIAIRKRLSQTIGSLHKKDVTTNTKGDNNLGANESSFCVFWIMHET
mgnify:CR=1 FL=1